MKSPKTGSVIRPRITGLALLLTACACWGCGESAQISEYTIPKEDKKSAGIAKPASQGPKEKARLLAAIVPNGDQNWFFKLLGPDEAIKGEIERFWNVMKSLEFSEQGKPEWTLPPNWRATGSSGMRYETIIVPTETGPLELTVSKLISRGGDFDDYLVQNINRWRKNDLGLPGITEEDLDETVTEVELKDGKAFLIGMLGWSQKSAPRQPPFAGGMGRPPFAGGGMPGIGNLPPSNKPPSFEVPEQWSKASPKPLSAATFSVAEGDQKVSVTMTPLGLIGSSLPSQIARWRGQFGPDAPNISESLEDIKAGPITGKLVKLVGSKSAKDRRGMLVGIVSTRDTTWYIKMFGDAELVLREQDRFKAFVESVRFSPDEEGGDE